MKLVYMGTPDFALPSLRQLHAAGHEILAVYCQPDKPQGRHFTLTPPPVKLLAAEYGIPVRQPATLKDEAEQAFLRSLAPELIVVAAYGKLLPPAVLSIPTRGCINVHGSLLPAYRGAAPIQWAVIDDAKTAGVTIMQMAEGLDTGDRLTTASVEIERMTAGELFDCLAEIGGELLLDTIEQLDEIVPTVQDESLASWARPLTKADGAVDFDWTMEKIDARVRGCSPWPGAFTIFAEKRLKIHTAAPAPEYHGAVGEILSDKQLVVGCANGAIELIEVQLEGGKRISGGDFLRGKRLRKGDFLCVSGKED